MSRVIDYMDEIGLTSIENIKKYFHETEIDVLFTFDEYMQSLVSEDWEIAEYSPYLFSPSLDVSGFGGCAELDCRIKRAERFAKFSCLYSDVVYLFVDSITLPHRTKDIEERQEQYRMGLMRDYAVIFVYSELIKRNVARIVPGHFSVCPDCFNELVKNDNELKIVDSIIEEYTEKVVIEALDYNKKHKLGFLCIKNLPEIFTDHDMHCMVKGRSDVAVLEKLKDFPCRIYDEKYVYEHVKRQIYNSYFTSKFESFMSSTYHSKLVTSRQFDQKLIGSLTDGGIGHTPPPVFDMPFLEKIDSETILKLRESENNIFENYRVALDKATKEYLNKDNLGKENEIYDDIVYPAFVKLDDMFTRIRRNRVIRTIGELAVTASTVTFGVMTSIIPANPIGVITALGSGGALVKQINKVIDNKMTSQDELAAKDMYFLWQLKNKVR